MRQPCCHGRRPRWHPDAKAPLRKVKPVANRPPDPVRRNPADEARIDTPLQHEVLEQPADVVFGERGHDTGAQAEAPAQPACHVVLAAALPRLEPAGSANPPLARIEPEHDLAQRDEVVAALLRRPNREPAHRLTSVTRVAASRARRVIATKSRAAISSGATIQLPPTAATDGSAR